MGNGNENSHPSECVMKERWAVQEIVNTQNSEGLEKIEAIVSDTHNRLFVGNGHPSMNTRVDRAESTLRIVCWVGGILGTAVIGFVAKSIITLVTQPPK